MISEEDRVKLSFPAITEKNTTAFVELEVSEHIPGMMKRQMAELLLKAICQEERRRCLNALLEYVHYRMKDISRTTLLEFVNEFEIEQLDKAFVGIKVPKHKKTMLVDCTVKDDSDDESGCC